MFKVYFTKKNKIFITIGNYKNHDDLLKTIYNIFHKIIDYIQKKIILFFSLCKNQKK